MPRGWRASPAAYRSAWVRTGPSMAASTLVWISVGQRRVADVLEALLGVGGGEVLEEGLGQGRLLGVLALGADDLVGDQEDRVGAGLLGGVVELEAQVVALAVGLGGQRRPCRPTRR